MNKKKEKLYLKLIDKGKGIYKLIICEETRPIQREWTRTIKFSKYGEVIDI